MRKPLNNLDFFRKFLRSFAVKKHLPKHITSDLTKWTVEAALIGASILKRGFLKKCKIQTKNSPHDFVTEYDLKSEKAILDFLKQKVPSASFIAEESGKDLKNETGPIWIIDPLDGTANFARGIPIFSVSIALVISNQVACGVVYNPMTDEMFIAEKGKGAFLNGASLSVCIDSELEKTMLITGFPHDVLENILCLEYFVSFAKLGMPIRRLGSAALDICYVAAGKAGGFFEYTLMPWDFAAAKLILEEAGGKITTFSNKGVDIQKKSSILASNSQLHSAMLSLIASTKERA